MFPPLTMATIGPLTRMAASSAPLNTAAVVAAPLGSATILAFEKIQSTASTIAGSSTVITASAKRLTCAIGQVARTHRHQAVRHAVRSWEA